MLNPRAPGEDRKTAFGTNASSATFKHHVQSEGPALTNEERAAFRDAVAAYHRTAAGSEERLAAIKTALPVLLRGYRTKAKEQNLPAHDKFTLSLVLKQIDAMVTELVTACNESDPHIRWLAFDVLKSVDSTRAIHYLAKEAPQDDIRKLAVQYLIDKRAAASQQKQMLRISGRNVDAKEYYDSLLVNVAIEGTYAETRNQVVSHFVESQDFPHLNEIKTRTRFEETQRLCIVLMRDMERRAASAEILADQVLQFFPGSVAVPEKEPKHVGVDAVELAPFADPLGYRKPSPRTPPSAADGLLPPGADTEQKPPPATVARKD